MSRRARSSEASLAAVLLTRVSTAGARGLSGKRRRKASPASSCFAWLPRVPRVLTQGGLRGAVAALARRIDVPIDVEIPDRRFPPEIEASAYFIVAEALTNIVKHAHATHADVTASANDVALRVEVHDDGVGGADMSRHGLTGIGDRVAALQGRLELESTPGAGTSLVATLPLSAADAR